MFTYIWQEDVAKISEVPGVPLNVNLARSITWLVSVAIHCTIFQLQVTSTWPVFTRQYTFEKKSAIGEMLIEQIIEFELRGPGPSGRTCTPITG